MAVIGIDEVGRGCWAGPLVVGAVVLNWNINGLTDSKLLSATKRTEFATTIYEYADFYATGWVWPHEIDELGLTAATTVAIKRALKKAPKDHPIVIDGSINYLSENPRAEAIVKADMTVRSVSAASIIAKVERDAYMQQQGLLYPEYGFERHVGYGTSQHRAALLEHGTTELHRRSYKPIQLIQSMRQD